MKTFTQVVRLSLIAMLCFFGQSAWSQSVINPADTIVTYNPKNPAPATPPLDGKVYKWLRTVRLSWDTREYKCYILNGTPFRVKFPKSYTTAADGKKYPIMVFFHGLGEAGPVTDNEISLYHGGQGFMQNVDNGNFDGFILVPQTQGGWGPYPTVKGILDYMIANNKVDPFHITENGLSAGAQGVWQFYTTYPTYISYLNPMSGVYNNYADSAFVNKVKYTAIWNMHGGLDGNPTPQTAALVLSFMQAGGANYRDKVYPSLGHACWDSVWLEPDFWPAMNRAYMSNPWPLFGRTKFCPGDTINVTIGLVAGMDGYQWRFNGNVIGGATGNTITATQPGTYDARIMRGGVWSDWSHTPVQIIIQSPTVTPPIQVSGLMTSVLPGADGKTSVNLTVPNAGTYTKFIWEQVGSNTVLGTSPVFTATQPGNYIVSVNTQYGCSSIFSPAFTVANAKGANGPAPVGNLVANSNSNTKVNLSWSLSPNQANPATALEVYRAIKTGGPYTLTALLSPTAVSYMDSLLNPNVKYFYTIRAVNGNAASTLANEASATTLSDTVPPTAPTNLTITGSTKSSIVLGWTAATDNVGVTQYDIYINGAKSYVTTQTSFVANGLSHGQTYVFTVKAEDGSGNISPQSNQVVGLAITAGLNYSYFAMSSPLGTLPDFTTMTPTATGISTNTNINLYINQTSVNFGYLWQGYITIPVTGTYKFQTTSDDGSKLWFNSYSPTGTATVNNDGAHASATVTSAALTLTAGVYPICIEYFQAGGGYNMSVSWISQQAFGNTNPVPIADSFFKENISIGGTAPAKPTGITATALAYNKIKVTWTDNSTNETGFEIYRATASAGPYTIVATVPAGTTSYTDSIALSASTKYTYRVQAINNYGSSGFDTTSTNNSATTLTLPAAPAVPTNLAGTALSSAIVQLSWQDSSPNLTGFALYRSFGDTNHFQLLANLPVTQTYKDSALFGHSSYYYKIMAVGVGGSSAFTPALLVNTLDNAPVVTNNAIRSLRYGTTATVTFTATDADGDPMTYSGVNLPGFATLVDNGNGKATLTLSPASSDAGNYTGIGVNVSDGAGGVTPSVFNLSVNNNYPPVITTIPDYTATTATTLSIPITASTSPGNVLTFKVSGAPGTSTLVAGTSNSDTLKITPNPGAKGLYTVIATVTDTFQASTSDTFHVNVLYKDPSQHIYIRPYAGDSVGAPWNSMTGVSDSNLVDANGKPTGVSITFTPWWWFPTYAGGQTTGNNSGVYPDAVLKDYLWWGVSGGPDTANATVSGLDPTKSYSIDMFGSATGAWYGGTIIYYINGQAQSLVVQNNTSGIVTFSNVKPNPDGTVAVKMAKGTGVQSGYWNAMVLTSAYDDGTAPLSPSQLTAQGVSGHGVQLNWQDSAYNASAYQIFRSTSATGPFTLLNTIAVPGTISYLDSPVTGNVKYYYTVNAINVHGASGYTDTAAVTTPYRLPVVNPITNVALKGGQSQTVSVTTVDDSSAKLRLFASNLPAYATFVDNGNGTGTVNINPATGVVDLSTVTITVKDSSDSSGSASFNISVVDKDVSSVYLAFTPGPIAPAPFNTVQAGGTTAPGFSFTNFRDDSNNPTNITLTLLNGFTYSVQYGMRRGNGNGLYPDLVLRNNFFETGTQKDSVKLSGLDPNKMYNLVFFASHDDNIPSVTNFSVGSQIMTLDASYNTNKTVAFNGLRSDANGNIVFGVQKAAGQYWCFLNALVIQSYDTSVPILSPADLRIIDKKTSSITLQWQDRSYNETGFEIWRSVAGGAYSLLTTVGPKVVSYKDSNLTPNVTYFYIVRSVNATTKSSYTQAASATTYAYSIDIHTADDNLPTFPWNNLATPPSPGVTWTNYFKDESGVLTSTKLMLNGQYAGGQPEGVVTGNNSGIYPDAVLAKEYITFPGQIGGFLFSNLDVNMKYDITFMPSINIWADNTTFYAVGKDTVIMSATLNATHVVTMLGESPDSKGNIQIWMGLYGASQQGTVNAMVINGYNPSTLSAPPAPVGTGGSNKTVTAASANRYAAPAQLNGDSVVVAFPNPFATSFTLSVPAEQNDKVTVMIYDLKGSAVYQKEFSNLNQGVNYLKIEPQWATQSGVYLVRMISSNGLSKYKVIKVVKM